MRSSFEHLPDSANSKAMHLIIEAGWYGVSFLFCLKDPFQVNGVLAYNFNGIQSEEYAENIHQMLSKEIFKESFQSVTLFYNFHESLLIPARFYNKDLCGASLSLIHGINGETIVKTESVENSSTESHGDLLNIYRIPVEIDAQFARYFPERNIIHSTSRQIVTSNQNRAECIIFHNTIKVILYKEGKLQLVQQFQYTIPADIVYYLLSACEKNNLVVNDTELLISGMIDASSSLYHELYKYFLHIRFAEVESNLFANSISQHPTHFFSHLTDLAKCVL